MDPSTKEEALDTFSEFVNAAKTCETHKDVLKLFTKSDLSSHVKDGYTTLVLPSQKSNSREVMEEELLSLDDSIDVSSLTKSELIPTYLKTFNSLHETTAVTMIDALHVTAEEMEAITDSDLTRAEFMCIEAFLASILFYNAVQEMIDNFEAIVDDEDIEHVPSCDTEEDDKVDTNLIVTGKRTRKQITRTEYVDFDTDSEASCNSEDSDFESEFDESDDDYIDTEEETEDSDDLVPTQPKSKSKR